LTLSVPVIFIADEPISAVWAKHFPLKVWNTIKLKLVYASDKVAINKGQLDAGLALKPNSTSVTNEINARITNEFTARITSDATLASTDVDKTANTPSLAWLIGRQWH
jgi:hypothetical protein